MILIDTIYSLARTKSRDGFGQIRLHFLNFFLALIHMNERSELELRCLWAMSTKCDARHRLIVAPKFLLRSNYCCYLCCVSSEVWDWVVM